MDAIQEIQEIVDENKDQMPTGAVTAIMTKCQEAYKALPKLYRAVMTKVYSFSYLDHCDDELRAEVKLQTATTNTIVECFDNEAFRCLNKCALHVFDEGIFHENWLTLPLPYTFSRSDGEVWILHSLTPYVKRSRED